MNAAGFQFEETADGIVITHYNDGYEIATKSFGYGVQFKYGD